MNVNEIKSAIRAGKRVFWKSNAYEVSLDSKGQYLICHRGNGSCIGLYGVDGVLNGEEQDFFITAEA